MAVNLGVDPQLDNLNNLSDDTVTFAELLTQLLIALFHSSSNPFGTAATRDVGNAAGNLPELNGNGHIQGRNLPTATPNVRGISSFAQNDELVSDSPPADKMVSAAQLVQSLPQLIPGDVASSVYLGVNSYFFARWLGSPQNIPAIGQTASGNALGFIRGVNTPVPGADPIISFQRLSGTWRLMSAIIIQRELALRSNLELSSNADALMGLWVRVS